MSSNWQFFVLFLGAYLIGSIPFGLLACKLGNFQDPRGAGSGNIGFTNVLRTSGKTAGVLTLLGDFGKGFLVAYCAQRYILQETEILVISFGVIVGHIFSIFLGFKGGKGVATAMGVLLGLEFFLGLILVGIWLIMVLIFKYSSGGALVSLGLLPIFAFFFLYSSEFMIFSVCLSVLIVFRHKSNIIQLLQGKESKIGHISS